MLVGKLELTVALKVAPEKVLIKCLYLLNKAKLLCKICNILNVEVLLDRTMKGNSHVSGQT